jgi:hypothetical protein
MAHHLTSIQLVSDFIVLIESIMREFHEVYLSFNPKFNIRVGLNIVQ